MKCSECDGKGTYPCQKEGFPKHYKGRLTCLKCYGKGSVFTIDELLWILFAGGIGVTLILLFQAWLLEILYV